MGNSGSKKLDEWSRLLKRSDVVLNTVSAVLNEETIDLVQEGFDRQRDPYDKEWARKKRPDGRKTLSGSTSRLRNGWHGRRVGRRGWVVAPSVNYALPHQDPKRGSNGKLKRPRRMMVPTGARGLPRRWLKRYREANAEVMRNYYRGALASRLKSKRK